MRPTPMLTVTRGGFGPPASQLLEQARAFGPIVRDELARRSHLSPATVNRTVASLLSTGLLRERPDRAVTGVNGRPGVPVEVDTSRFVTLGFHLGRGVDTVAIGDLRGRVLVQASLPRAVDAAPDLEVLARAAARLLAGQVGRAPLSAGLVAPWPDLGLEPIGTGHALESLLGLDVATADHVAGVAATEFLHRRPGTSGATLYLYARNTIGFALVVDKGPQTEVSRVGSLTHFPSGSTVRCGCGRLGCLTATHSDHAVVARAVARGALTGAEGIDDLVAAARGGDRVAHDLLAERADALGSVAAVVRDIVAPDRVVLVGQGFTAYPAVLPLLTATFAERTSLGEIDVSFTRFGAGVQAITACTVALGPVYDDPLGVVPAPRSNPIATKGNIA